MPYQGLDVTDFFRRTSGLGSEKDPTEVKLSPTAGMFSAARDYGSGFGRNQGFGLQDIGGLSNAGVNSLLGGMEQEREAEIQAGATALGAIGDRIAAEKLAKAQEQASSRTASAQKDANTKGLIGAIGGAAVSVGIGALI